MTDRPVRVGVVRLPHLANPSDLDPLVLEPDVELRWVSTPGDLIDVDLVILPGSRSTVGDLGWLRERGLDRALATLGDDPDGPFVIGICAGYQMLGRTIHDGIESGAGTVAGLGRLPVRTVFTTPKTVRRAQGVVADGSGTPVEGYEIRWGRPERPTGTSSPGSGSATGMTSAPRAASVVTVACGPPRCTGSWNPTR